MKMRGFTLVELMVAVALFAILSAIAVPSFREFSARQRLRAASFDLRTDLMLARSEALKRNRDVTIAPREADGWQTGWIVRLDGTAQALRSRNDIGPRLSISSPVDAITFNGSGRVSSPGGIVQIGITAAAGAFEMHRCLVLAPSGMPRTRTEACS